MTMIPSGVALRLEVLGKAVLKFGSREVVFETDKRHQMLAYLAASNTWVSRDKLADLFWSQSPSQTAKQNLRQLLQGLKGLPWLENLEVERQRLRWQIPSDLGDFQQALEARQWERALELYGGGFLQGLEGFEDNEFASWLEFERQNFYGRWREAVFARAGGLEAQAAARCLHALLEQDPLDEEGLQAYMNATARAGQPQLALGAYQDFVRQLEHQLGLEPSSATRQLAQSIEAQPALTPIPHAPSSESTPQVLPTPASSFVGRDLELGEIANLLSNPQCRVLSLVGLGGVGKTRLALQAASELNVHYPHGVYFIELATLTAGEGISSRVAEVLGLRLRGSEPAIVQLSQAIGAKRQLLVLDNFEHLMEGAEMVAVLVQQCPNLTLLVTTRERLNLTEEWGLVIEGLAVPGETLSLDQAAAFDAVALFEERAQRVQPGFTLTPQDLPGVLAICRLVQGFPLGIELAAVWVRMMSTQEIADEIGHSLDFLSGMRSQAERHRGLRATFEYSWQLLTPIEQNVLSKLSVFQGGFTREAAASVAGANIVVLKALVDKSLLRILPAGRYDQHPLIYQYGREKLEAHPEGVSTRAKHAAYFCQLLEQSYVQLRGHQQTAVLDRIDQEFGNIRLAWAAAIRVNHFRSIKPMVLTLYGYCDRRSKFQAGLELLGQAIEHLSSQGPSAAIALGYCRIAQAWFYMQTANLVEAIARAEQGIELLGPHQEWNGLRRGYNTLAMSFWRMGEIETTRTYMTKGLQMAQADIPDEVPVVELNNLGIVEKSLGNSEAAETLLKQALAGNRQKENTTGIAGNIANLGEVYLNLNQLDKAEAAFKEALEIARAHNFIQIIPSLFSNLGTVAYLQQQYELAQGLLLEALALNEQHHNHSERAAVLGRLGQTDHKLGNLEEAKHYLREGLSQAVESGDKPFMLLGFLGIAELWLGQGNAEEAHRLLQIVAFHPASEPLERTQAKSLLEKPSPDPSPAQTHDPDLVGLAQTILVRWVEPG